MIVTFYKQTDQKWLFFFGWNLSGIVNAIKGVVSASAPCDSFRILLWFGAVLFSALSLIVCDWFGSSRFTSKTLFSWKVGKRLKCYTLRHISNFYRRLKYGVWCNSKKRKLPVDCLRQGRVRQLFAPFFGNWSRIVLVVVYRKFSFNFTPFLMHCLKDANLEEVLE